MTQSKFRFSIDRGGTFTDIYAEVRIFLVLFTLTSQKVPGEPGFKLLKLLSVDPQNYKDAPREGIRRILEQVCTSLGFDLTCHE